ncbi:MAG TPA: tetratricopeptide repeat protein, partial [Pyrinomonadaceae bacterium]
MFLTGIVFGSTSQEEEETGVLVLKAPVVRDFKTGARHIFSVSVREKEAVEITCERRGVDIGLAVFAPTGEKISVSNAPAGFAGFDRIFFIAETAGEYRLELDSRRPGSLTGSYTILLKDQRAATEADFVRAAAMKLLGEARAELTGAENRFEKSARAAESLEKALALFEQAEDLQGQAIALFHIALIKGYEFGDKTKSIELYEKALDIWGKIDDEAGRAICLTYLADEIRDYDNAEHARDFYTEKARKYFDEALSLYRKLNDKPDEAAALSFLCRLFNDTGNFQKGFETCRESQRLGGDRDPLTDYRTYGTLASLYSNSGDLENALEHNQIALERLAIAKDYVNPYRSAFIKGNMGLALANQKKYAEAEQNLREALAITEREKRTLYSGYTLVRLASILYDTKRFPESLDCGKKAVEYYRAVDPIKIQGALNVLGNTYFALGQVSQARALFTEAVEINRRTKDRYAEAESLYNLARLENHDGNPEAARQNIEL